MTKQKIERMSFIPEISGPMIKAIVIQIGTPTKMVEEALVKWEAGGEAKSILERMCFDCFDQIAETIRTNSEGGYSGKDES